MKRYKYIAVASFVLSITGCVTTKLPPPPCSAPAGTASAVDDKHSVFGVALGQPVTFPECKREKYSTDGYSIGGNNCYKRTVKPQDCAAIQSGYTVIEFPALTLPYWTKDSSMVLRVINGNVEGIRVTTRGIQAQSEALSALTQKYGKPSYSQKNNVQNRMGASFEVLNASWKVGDISVILLGTTGMLDKGRIEISTKIGKAAFDADAAKLDEHVKPL